MKLTDKSRERVRFLLNIVTSLLLILSGVLFIIFCYSIYKSGESPFTRESIYLAFVKISVPVWITVGAVIVSGVFSVVFPKEQSKLKGMRTDRIVLSKLRTTREFSNEYEVEKSIEHEERLRRILSCVNVVLIVLGSTLPLIFLLNPNNFPAVSGEYNSEIGRGMLVYLATLLPAFVYGIVYVVLFDRSVKREIDLVRSLPKKKMTENYVSVVKCGGVLSKIKLFFSKNAKEITLGTRIAIILCGVVFVVAGVLNGGMSDVLKKAIKICTECIGLG